MGLEPTLEVIKVFTDSSVAKSFVATRGLGKMRHLEVKLLWLQECVQRGRLKVGKVKGTNNVADILTKYLSVSELALVSRPHGICCKYEADPHDLVVRAEGGVLV
jgi:hypothetical protein